MRLRVTRRCAARSRAAAAPAGPDFSSLERHLIKITSQIEALQRPDHVEHRSRPSAANSPKSATPSPKRCRAGRSNSIENEIRSLSRRIDENRQNGIDGQVLAGIERALGEIREALRSLKPAEQLAGYDDAIRNLGAKLDLILRANDDPSTVHQLESAISALRAIVSNVASNDALVRLSDDVQTLSAKVDQLSRSGDNSDSFAVLEQRIAALTSTLESRRAAGRATTIPNISKARCARCPNGSTAFRSATTTPRPLPISNSGCRICWSGWKPPATDPPRRVDLGRVEEGLQDILRSSRTPARQSGHPRRQQPLRPPQPRRSRWTPASSTSSSASCPTSASASRKPTAARRIRWRPFTTRSAMSSIAWR